MEENREFITDTLQQLANALYGEGDEADSKCLGCDDSIRENLLKEVKKLKEFRNDVIDTLKYDEDATDSQLIEVIDEMENDWDPNHYEELKKENKELKEQIFGIKDSDMKIEGLAEQVVRLASENKTLKDKSKGFKKLFKEVKRLRKELGERNEEINDLNETITRVQKERNYLGDYEGGATSEEEEEEEESSEEEEEEENCEECGKSLEGEDKCGKGCPSYDKGWKETHDSDSEEEEEKLMSPNEYIQDWLKDLSVDYVGDEELYISGTGCRDGLQDRFEGDMAYYFQENRPKMCPKMKEQWGFHFDELDDDKPYFHSDVGILADWIEDYYLNTLKVSESKMDEWRESFEKAMYEEEES